MPDDEQVKPHHRHRKTEDNGDTELYMTDSSLRGTISITAANTEQPVPAPRLIMLGTGNAAVTKCYNTCFVIKTEKMNLLVDAGGGNGILSQLEKARLKPENFRHMIVTHAHTDHILGAIWIIRMIVQKMLKDQYDGDFTIYSHTKVLEVLRWNCRMLLPEKNAACMEKRVVMREVSDGEYLAIEDIGFTFFDIMSTKEKQYGFRAELPNRRSLVCLGDEPFNEHCRQTAENCRWLMSEAFCLYEDRGKFNPYEKHHSTALDTGKLASSLNAERLIVYHTEDSNLAGRKKLYSEEAARNFSGNIFVPDDLEEIVLD